MFSILTYFLNCRSYVIINIPKWLSQQRYLMILGYGKVYVKVFILIFNIIFA